MNKLIEETIGKIFNIFGQSYLESQADIIRTSLNEVVEAMDKEIEEKLLEKLQKRKREVILENKYWNEKGRRIGNWELGYDDAEFDAEEIIKQVFKISLEEPTAIERFKEENK